MARTPLGARTMYLGGTVYRIHGTNEPQTIGKFVSSGCFRMLNADVEDLYDRAKVGTKVVILPKRSSAPRPMPLRHRFPPLRPASPQPSAERRASPRGKDLTETARPTPGCFAFEGRSASVLGSAICRSPRPLCVTFRFDMMAPQRSS